MRTDAAHGRQERRVSQTPCSPLRRATDGRRERRLAHRRPPAAAGFVPTEWEFSRLTRAAVWVTMALGRATGEVMSDGRLAEKVARSLELTGFDAERARLLVSWAHARFLTRGLSFEEFALREELPRGA